MPDEPLSSPGASRVSIRSAPDSALEGRNGGANSGSSRAGANSQAGAARWRAVPGAGRSLVAECGLAEAAATPPGAGGSSATSAHGRGEAVKHRSSQQPACVPSRHDGRRYRAAPRRASARHRAAADIHFRQLDPRIRAPCATLAGSSALRGDHASVAPDGVSSANRAASFVDGGSLHVSGRNTILASSPLAACAVITRTTLSAPSMSRLTVSYSASTSCTKAASDGAALRSCSSASAMNSSSASPASAPRRARNARRPPSGPSRRAEEIERAQPRARAAPARDPHRRPRVTRGG